MKTDIGVCSQHQRQYEAYCERCRAVVCADCIMYGSHTGHSVIPPAQAAQFIRGKLAWLQQAGRLNPCYTEEILQEVRTTKQEADRLRSRVLAQVDNKFDALITALKRRQEELKQTATEHFQKELQNIHELETRWEARQEVSQSLMHVLREHDDPQLIRECCTLFQNIEEVDSPLEVRIFKLLSDLSLHLAGPRPLSHVQLVTELENLGEFGEPQQNEFSC